MVPGNGGLHRRRQRRERQARAGGRGPADTSRILGQKTGSGTGTELILPEEPGQYGARVIDLFVQGVHTPGRFHGGGRKMRGLVLGGAIAVVMTVATGAVRAEIDGHGPDAWRVVGVAADGVLNMRMGPGTEYFVIDRLPPDARGLELITCVPLLIPSVYQKLTEAQRADLPQRWCLMRTADLTRAGWVAQRFLAEDVRQGAGASAGASGPNTLDIIGDAMIDEAVFLVRDLYAAFESQTGASDNPFGPTQARRYFFADIAPSLTGHGADILYDAQDFDGRIARIGPDRDQPMFRGMITVTVDLANFGQARQIVFRLRPDPTQSGAPLRVFRIELDGWSFPQ